MTTMNAYSRQSPSPRYVELLGYYREMHVHGARAHGATPEQTFPGLSLLPHAERIRNLTADFGAKTILDYGAGKGRQYELNDIRLPDGPSFPNIAAFWNVESITCYDPGYEPHNKFPTGVFDGVVTTDALEHCPVEDLPWIVAEIFGFAREFVYLNVACYPALKSLPNGENAHCTVEPIDWWIRMFDAELSQHPHLQYFAAFEVLNTDAKGNQPLNTHLHQNKWKPNAD